MARRKLKVKGPKGKLRTRNMYDGIQGTTVRAMDDKQLPTGCCVLRNGIPCTYRMVNIEVKVERMWLPSEEAEVPVVKMLGYCKTHTPRFIPTIALGRELERRLNGPRTQKARMRKQEDAMYVNMVPQGGVIKHKVLRSSLTPGADAWYLFPVDTACGKHMKQGYIPSLKEAREEYPKDCPKCEAAIRIIT